MKVLVDLKLTEDGILQSIDNIIPCPFVEDGDCCGTLLQTDRIGILVCNECGAKFELFQHGE